MMKPGLSLRAYLLSLVLGATLPLIAMLAFFIYHDAVTSSEREAAAASNIAENIAYYVSRFLAKNNLELEILERQQSLRLLDPAHCRSALADFHASNPHYTNVMVRDRAGNPVCDALGGGGVPQFSRDPESFEQVLRENRLIIGKPYLGRRSERWVALLRQPINNDKGRVMGVIGAAVDLVKFKITDTEFKTPTGTITHIVDAAGTVIASSREPEHWVGRNVLDTAIVGIMLAQRHGKARAVGIDGSENIFGFTAIPGTDWFVASGIPVEVIFGEMKRDLLRIMLATAVILALVCVFSYRFARAITIPIDAIATTANRIVAGAHDVRAKPGGPRELSVVATQFNAMLDAQLGAHRQLSESEERFKHFAEMSSDWLWEQDANLRFTKIFGRNPLGEGTPIEEFIGKHRWDIPYAGITAGQLRQINALQEARQPFRNVELQRFGPDGKPRYLSISGDPVLDAHGNFKGYRGVGTDITERKQGDETRARLAAIVENSNDAMISRSLDFIITSWNAAAERILGYTAEEAIGRDITGNFPPGLRQEAMEIRRLVAAGTPVPYFETVRITKNGRRIDAGLNVSPIRDKDGRITGTATILRDITERKQAEEAQTRLAAIVESSQDAIISRAFDGTVLSWNSAAERILGYTAAESIGRDVKIFPPDLLEHVAGNRQRLQAGKSMPYHETVRITKDGRRIDVGVTLSPIKDSGGNAIGFSAILRDITERKRAEHVLQQQALIFENATDAIMILDAQRRIIDWNPASERLFGYRKDEVLGKVTEFLYPPEDYARYTGLITEMITRGERWAMERIMLCKDGSERICETVRAPLLDGGGTLIGRIGISRDITERKKTERALLESESQLRHALEERERLSRDLHDGIVQEVYAIGLGLEEAQRLIAPDARAAGSKVAEEIEHLNAVIRGVRKHIIGAAPQLLTGQQLRAELTALAKTMQNARALRFRLEVDAMAVSRLSPDVAPHVLNIAREAMSNSLRHSGGHSGLVLLRQHLDGVRLIVEDDGVGFNLKQARVRGHGLRNIETRAHEIAARLEVHSDPGHGTRIIVDVPVGQSHAAA